MWKRIHKWYEGEYVPFKNDSDSMLVILDGDYKRHWTARVARVLVEFWMKHWQWMITASIAVVGLIIAAMKL